MNENIHAVGILERASTSQPEPLLTPPKLEKSPAKRRILPWLLKSGPTVIVLALLGGLAYWGHHTGWTIPKFSDLVGNNQPDADDWCKEHSVPESECVECDETLLPRIESVWCRKHEVHFCPFERPEIAQLKSLPKITQADLDRAQRALDLKDRTSNNKKCTLHHRRLQFASLDVMNKMGIGIDLAGERPITETVAASGEIAFEQPRVAPVTMAVSGRVWLVTEKGQIGAVVKRGDVLALVDALEIGKAKAEFQQAFAQLDLRTKTVGNVKPAVDKGAIPETRLLELETAQREAQIRLMGAQQALVNLGLPVRLEDVKSMSLENLSKYLQFFGIPKDIVERLNGESVSANLFPVLAPRDGVVTVANTVPGDVVDAAKVLFVVADTSRMWLILNVRNEDLKYLRIRDPKTGKPGQAVRFRADGSDKEVTGELVWKSTQVDEKTRTVQFRAELPNPDRSLLANTFGHGQIVLREESVVVIPTEALHWEGDCNIVFVQDKNFHTPGAPKVFHVRTVRPGVKVDRYTEIIAGLMPGEVVATTNSATIRAELRKNSLGAG
ncbi:MAG: efflux RND transporter periplasmic adaptor subunit [Planctomycetes bacterium]|nr:efflux RND transporter periplasmic adaptor subunit [Planctomycetota bacterium]